MTKFYAIGIGPGNEDYLTLKAADILKNADVVFCPQSEIKKESLAFTICERHINPGAKIVNLVFPMTKNKDELKKYWTQAADTITSEIKTAKTAAFITLGDPSVYSTYSYIADKLKEIPSIEVCVVPGITAFTACAAVLNIPLVEADDKMALLPASDIGEIENAIDRFQTIVLYKVAKNLENVAALLKRKNLSKQSFLISHVSTEKESIENLDSLSEKEKGYFSTIIIKTKKSSIDHGPTTMDIIQGEKL